MKLTVGKGIDKYLDQLGDLYLTAPAAIGEAVYQGADIVADQIKRNINGIPSDDRVYVKNGMRTGLRSLQKSALKASFGIAKLRDDNGYANVKAGWDGYNKIKTKKYPKGQPNMMIARTIESGNSFTQKHPFVAPAVRQTRDKAERKMAEVIDAEISKIMK